MAMHNYEIRHGDLINSHNIRAYKVSKMLYARADVRVCVCVYNGAYLPSPNMCISGRRDTVERIYVAYKTVSNGVSNSLNIHDI